MTDELKIGVMGVTGRMSQALRQAVASAPDMVLVNTGKGASRELFDRCDVVLDFTTPDASVEHAKLAAETKCALVIGTTGFTAIQEQVIAQASVETRIIKSGNTSLGVNLMVYLSQAASSILGDDFEASIVETHHANKVDTPSGTAIMVRDAVLVGRDPPPDIDIDSFRKGETVGEHEVIFKGAGESISIRHVATDRAIYARGALQAARWLADVDFAGCYDMGDVLGI